MLCRGNPKTDCPFMALHIRRKGYVCQRTYRLTASCINDQQMSRRRVMSTLELSQMSKQHIFISHATPDKAFVQELHEKLKAQGIDAWIDRRELTGGNALEPEIKDAIAESSQVLVVLSPKTINSRWVTKEVQYALELQMTRKDGFKVIPLLTDGIEPAALDHWFGTEPVGIKLTIEPGGLEQAMPAILAALGERLPIDTPTSPAMPASPMAELILELTDTSILQAEGKRRAVATATLIYRPPDPAAREVRSRRYRFTAPLGPIESAELTWYLESY